MPLLWRYLIFDYVKGLLLCALSFIAVLLTLRFDDIAHFACLGSSWQEIFKFVLLQIPYLLPIALPIAALISSYLLFSRLSHRQEITALRSCGLSLGNLLSPVLLCSLFLTLAAFYVTSEVASNAHLANGQIRHQLRTLNPLLLLENKKILQLQGIFCETLGASYHGEFAKDVVLALPHRQNRRIALFLAKNLSASGDAVEGQNTTFITNYLNREGFDQLAFENIDSLTTPYHAFSPALQHKSWTVRPDHLNLGRLQAHLKYLHQSLKNYSEDSVDEYIARKEALKKISQTYSELTRRFSLSFYLFSFTLLGSAFSITIGRVDKKQKLIVLSVLAGLSLVCYFFGKSFEDKWIHASLFYLLPHCVLILASLWMLHRTHRGQEL